MGVLALYHERFCRSRKLTARTQEGAETFEIQCSRSGSPRYAERAGDTLGEEMLGVSELIRETRQEKS